MGEALASHVPLDAVKVPSARKAGWLEKRVRTARVKARKKTVWMMREMNKVTILRVRRTMTMKKAKEKKSMEMTTNKKKVKWSRLLELSMSMASQVISVGTWMRSSTLRVTSL